mgnify:FL=1
MLKKKRTILVTKKEIEDYNNSIDEEERNRIENGKPRRGKAKKHKDIPVWDSRSAMEEIISKKVYEGHAYLRAFTSVKVSLDQDGNYTVEWTVDSEAQETYCRKYYGKKLTVTDRKDLSLEDILNIYLDQECIENGIFRVSKDISHFSVRPQYHWTDDKILTHVFICMSSIVLAEVLLRHIEKDGFNLTKSAMLDRLDEIHDGWIVNLKDKKSYRSLEILDEEHQKLWDSVEKLSKKRNRGKKRVKST